MAELSNMPLLDENKNTSTLNNHVPGSDDSLLSATNNGLKNITSDNTYQSPTSVKGNFSEINSNINVLSPKNLNILSPEPVGGSFLKSEVANGSLLEKTNNSFNTANESLLEESNNSFKSLNGSYLEFSKPPNCSVKNLLDETLTKVEAPPLCLSPSASLELEDVSNSENSLNESNECVSFNEVSNDGPIASSLITSSLIASPMGNNPSSDESKTVGKSPLNNSISAKSSSANRASFIEDKSNTPVKNLLANSSTVESPSTIQASFTGEKPGTSTNTLFNTSTAESSTFDYSKSVDKSKSSVVDVLDTSTLEPPANQALSSEIKPDINAKSLLNTSTGEMAPVDNISFNEDKLNSSVKSVLDTTSTVEVDTVNQISFTEDKSNPSLKSPLDATSTITLEASVDQTLFTEDKSNSSVKSILDTTSNLELTPGKQTSFTESNSNSSGKGILDTTWNLELTPGNQTSLTESNSDSSVKGILDTTSNLELTSCSQTSFVEEKSNSSCKNLLNTTSTFELAPNDPTSFTEDMSNSSLKSQVDPVEVTSSKNEPASPAKSPLDTSSSVDLPSVIQTSFTEGKPDTSVASLQDISLKSSLQDSYSLPGILGNEDVSMDKTSSPAIKSASFTTETALSDFSPSNKVPENISGSALDEKSLTSVNSYVASGLASQNTPKNIGQKLDSSRLIDFSMIQDGSTDEKSPFKVPSIKLDSATPDLGISDLQRVSHSSIDSIEMSATDIPETFDGGLQDIPGNEITVTGEDPFGMQKSDPFDLITKNATPTDDFVFKVPENPVNVENEEFTDAVQFFKDPSSFQFLENIKTSSQGDADVPRSSLYIKFDPLHSIFPSQRNPDGNDILQALKNEANVDPNNHLNASSRESLGNILISFDSPRFDCRDVPTPVKMAPVKVYTEEELQQHLKVSELTNQEMLLKKQREMEEELARKECELVARADEKDARIEKVENLLKAQSQILQEFVLISAALKEQNKDVLKKMETLEEENTKLKGDVKTLTDDLQSVETTFADFHKRYEQCKGMLKTYKENEELLRTKLKEQEQAYQDLQNSTQEASAKTNSEIASVKKTSEGQIAVLRAQLKKAELKISSLESDINKIKIENSQLGGLCDDLMEKVGKS